MIVAHELAGESGGLQQQADLRAHLAGLRDRQRFQLGIDQIELEKGQRIRQRFG